MQSSLNKERKEIRVSMIVLAILIALGFLALRYDIQHLSVEVEIPADIYQPQPNPQPVNLPFSHLPENDTLYNQFAEEVFTAYLDEGCRYKGLRKETYENGSKEYLFRVICLGEFQGGFGG